MLRFTGLAALLLVAATFAPAQDVVRPQTGTAADEPAYRADPRFQKALAAARTGRMTTDERLSAWKKANKTAGNVCTECLHEIIVLDFKSGEYSDSMKAANQLLALATLPRDKFFAEAEIGASLLHDNGDKPKHDKLEQADAAFKAALVISPHAATVRYEDARSLALLGRFDDSKAMFTAFLADAKPDDPYRTRAQHFAEDPKLATAPMAPPFTVHTAQGETFDLDNMQGKVVLIDFWATWCGPCRETLPDVKRIAAKYKDAPLVVLSVSGDADADAWSKMVAKEGMTWPQYRDADKRLSNAYGVSSIPRFFTIDTNGVLQDVHVGSGVDLDGMVRSLVSKASSAQKRKAATVAQTLGGQ